MKIPTYLVWLGLSLALSGCGISTVSPSVAAATKAAAAAATSPVETVVAGDITKASYNAANDTLTISGLPFDNGLLAANYTRDAALDQNGFKAYVNSNGTKKYVALWGISNNGTGAVSAGVVATGSFTDNGYNGAVYNRNVASVLPTSGIATYTGRYAGLLTTNPKTGLKNTSGSLALTVDFANSKVDGKIANHQSWVGTASTAMGDIVLVTGTVAAGKFSGVTSSGTGPVTTAAPATGIYQGIIGGPSGGEVAGIIILGTATTATRETGAFVSDAVTVLPKP